MSPRIITVEEETAGFEVDKKKTLIRYGMKEDWIQTMQQR